MDLMILRTHQTVLQTQMSFERKLLTAAILTSDSIRLTCLFNISSFSEVFTQKIQFKRIVFHIFLEILSTCMIMMKVSKEN